MTLEEARKEIDAIDDQLVTLFQARMDVAANIAKIKMEQNLPVYHAGREREKLADVAGKSRDEMKEYTRVLYTQLFELSRTYQDKLMGKDSPVYDEITHAIESTPRVFPKSAMVACQGVEGAYSQIACEKLFRKPQIMYFQNFDGVFSAIEKGLCKYGMLPIENSTAGSVKKVYDLMIRHRFHIVRSVRIKIDHNLLANRGATLSGIREIFSHEQAINQSSAFLKSLGNVKVTAVENTAVAAEMVVRSGRTDVAALSSRSCAELYGLECLAASVQDTGNNHTRFICISKDLEIYPGADKSTLMLVLPHKPGSLYKILARLYTLDINLLKLESRPIPDRDFEFMFYLDVETSVYSEDFAQMISDLNSICEECKYLGSYTEVV
ncbi:MAG: chorismate mutase [Clostridia bacterium]|nr:chorismate mutase [Clostridia bacterium]